MTRKTSLYSVLSSLSYWIFVGLLAYAPVHIFLSTVFGHFFGVLEVFKALKDVVMVFGFALTVGLVINKIHLSKLLKDRLLVLIIAYGLLTLALATIRPTDRDAEILGLVYNTRFLVFFMYGYLLSLLVDSKKLRRHSLVAVLSSALFVLFFGIVQYTIMPNDWLSRLGYGRENGVLPAFFIDDKPDLERIMSTVRDPNSFGSYVIIILCLAVALLLNKKKEKNIALGFVGLSVLCLWFTFSRSAWIGAIAGLATMISLHFSKRKIKPKTIKSVAVSATVLMILAGSTLFVMKDSYFVKNVVFHADESTVLEDPNELRVKFWKESVQDIASDPVGSGPGTAGLASIKNNVQGTELNENYYLQIASEVGIVGLALFLGILVIVFWRLVCMAQHDWLALALLGSFVGLALTNFLVHIWANEAVAYTWWGLASLVLATTVTKATKKSTN